jgi:hypothetical protein
LGIEILMTTVVGAKTASVNQVSPAMSPSKDTRSASPPSRGIADVQPFAESIVRLHPGDSTQKSKHVPRSSAQRIGGSMLKRKEDWKWLTA